MPAEDFQITLQPDGEAVRIVVVGELDIATAPQLLERLDSGHSADGGVAILDLTRVTFIDSSGLLAVMDTAERLGERVAIIPSDACLRLFELVGVTGHLPLLERP